MNSLFNLINKNPKEKTIHCNSIAYDKFYTSIAYIEKPKSIGWYIEYAICCFLSHKHNIDNFKTEGIESGFFTNYKITVKINHEIYDTLKKYAAENKIEVSILIYAAMLEFAKSMKG